MIVVVVRAAATIAVVGAGIGVIAALAMSSLLSALLFRVSTDDVVTYVAAVIIVVGAGVAASAVPAYRAGRLDPMAVLRQS
jgi:ABC-type antimicrobial peptide transport system permease subunit